jgi:hypothetical protein
MLAPSNLDLGQNSATKDAVMVAYPQFVILPGLHRSSLSGKTPLHIGKIRFWRIEKRETVCQNTLPWIHGHLGSEMRTSNFHSPFHFDAIIFFQSFPFPFPPRMSNVSLDGIRKQFHYQILPEPTRQFSLANFWWVREEDENHRSTCWPLEQSKSGESRVWEESRWTLATAWPLEGPIAQSCASKDLNFSLPPRNPPRKHSERSENEWHQNDQDIRGEFPMWDRGLWVFIARMISLIRIQKHQRMGSKMRNRFTYFFGEHRRRRRVQRFTWEKSNITVLKASWSAIHRVTSKDHKSRFLASEQNHLNVLPASAVSRYGDRVLCRGKQSSEMRHDQEGSQFWFDTGDCRAYSRTSLFFHAECYAEISGARKKHVSEFFTRNSGSEGFLFDGFHTSSHRTWKSQPLPCQINFLKDSNIDKQRILWIFWSRTSRGSFWSISSWCLDGIQRWGTGNIHDKNWEWQVHDFDHLVHFWNAQSTCIDQRYEIQFSVFLSKCYSG